MVTPAEGAGLFNSQDVHRALDHAEQRSIALRVGTNTARIYFRKTTANVALPYALARGEHGGGEPLRSGRFGLH
jgi:hypothetical protein